MPSLFDIKNKIKKRTGRWCNGLKSKYDEKTIKKAKADYKKGKTLKEISNKYNIPYSTVQTWRKRYWSNLNGVDGRKESSQQNAIKNTGPHSIPYYKFMTDEEKAILMSGVDTETEIQRQINLCTIRELRILAAIDKYRSSCIDGEMVEDTNVIIAENSTYIKENGEKKRAESHKVNPIHTLIRLEGELNKVQTQKAKYIKELTRIRLEEKKLSLINDGKEKDVVDDWITATIETGGDEFET